MEVEIELIKISRMDFFSRKGNFQDGVENASVSLRQPCCGLFACTAATRWFLMMIMMMTMMMTMMMMINSYKMLQQERSS